MTAAQSAHLKKRFLLFFRQHGNVKRAAEQAKIERRRVVYEWLERDDAFAAEFREAEIEATEHMEAEAYRRGVEGVKKPVYQGGKKVGTVQEYSDVLLIFMLKARAPEKYRENFNLNHSGQIEHVGMEHARGVLRVVGGAEHTA